MLSLAPGFIPPPFFLKLLEQFSFRDAVTVDGIVPGQAHGNLGSELALQFWTCRKSSFKQCQWVDTLHARDDRFHVVAEITTVPGHQGKVDHKS